MLTIETLKANELLKDIDESKLKAIMEMSKNDEDTVIGKKVFDIHSQYDYTIQKSTGIKREGDEKSYDYLARAGKILRDQVNEFSEKIKSMGDPGKLDEALSNENKQLKNDLILMTDNYSKTKTKLDNFEKSKNEEIHNTLVAVEYDKAISGIKFKSEYPESVVNLLKQQAVNNIKSSYKTDFVDESGNKRLIFRNPEDNTEIRNPDNNLNPFTLTELLNKELKDVIDDGRESKGSGTKPNNEQKDPSIIDVSGAKTKFEAADIIAKSLTDAGLSKGSAEYSEKYNTIYKENKVAEMPERV